MGNYSGALDRKAFARVLTALTALIVKVKVKAFFFRVVRA